MAEKAKKIIDTDFAQKVFAEYVQRGEEFEIDGTKYVIENCGGHAQLFEHETGKMWNWICSVNELSDLVIDADLYQAYLAAKREE